jgi:hypothetical protein
MELAASAANRIHAPDILTTVIRRAAPPSQTEPELSVWENEGGHLAGDSVYRTAATLADALPRWPRTEPRPAAPATARGYQVT